MAHRAGHAHGSSPAPASPSVAAAATFAANSNTDGCEAIITTSGSNTAATTAATTKRSEYSALSSEQLKTLFGARALVASRATKLAAPAENPPTAARSLTENAHAICASCGAKKPGDSCSGCRAADPTRIQEITTRAVALADMTPAMLLRFLAKLHAPAEALAYVRERQINGELLAALIGEVQPGGAFLHIADPLVRARIRVGCCAAARVAPSSNGTGEPAKSVVVSSANKGASTGGADQQLQKSKSKGASKKKTQTSIRVGYKVSVIGQVDTVMSTFYCDFKLFAWWVDPSLANRDVKGAPVDWGKKGVFDPQLTVINEHDIQPKNVGHKLTKSTEQGGHVKWSAHFHGTLFVYMDLRYFPFDFQVNSESAPSKQ
jgi:hypothetical protein